MTKIKNIEIFGIRGIKNNLPINLDPPKSLLIFGDNGSGKSSITDALEWFFYDRIEHLSTGEIGRGGISGLRNISLPPEKTVYTKLQFTDNKIGSKKQLFYKKAKLNSNFDNKGEEFKEYINKSQNENLILRYRDLIKFIALTKSQKLEEIQTIIGFDRVSHMQGIFKKAVNRLSSIKKNRDYENQKSRKQREILERIKKQIYTDQQYFKAINDLVKPLNLGFNIKDHSDVDKALKAIKSPEDEQKIVLQSSYEESIISLKQLKDLLDKIQKSYDNCLEKYQPFTENLSKLKKINLESLLSESTRILKNKYFEEDKCPVCLQDRDRKQLINELGERIRELKTLKKEKEEIQQKIEKFNNYINGVVGKLNTLLEKQCFKEEKNTTAKEKIKKIQDSLKEMSSNLQQLREFKLTSVNGFKINITTNKGGISESIILFRKNSEDLKKSAINKSKITIYSDVEIIKNLYKDIKQLENESDVLSRQINTIQIIKDNFTARQKEGLSNFLNLMSKDINDLYLYMNPSENVDEIKLVPLGEEDDLVGITMQYKFHGKTVSPPDKYLSEAHLSCLGICLFLVSAKAFNKKNDFLILDDIISSYDTDHRVRLAQLLVRESKRYQFIVFTHDKEWFGFFSNMIKGQWEISTIYWTSSAGVQIDVSTKDLKNKISDKFAANNQEDLGNNIRKYLERLLKEISYNLEVRVPFRYNETNEDRMVYELLTSLKREINKKGDDQLRKNPIFERLLSSNFIGNKDSHDAKFNLGIGDCKAFWEDVSNLESVFVCDECKKNVSMRNYDTVNKKIRCKCGAFNYSWKR